MPATSVAIAGATGFVGRRLARRLAADGMTVRCLARRPEAVEDRPGLVPVQVDITDEEGLTRALAGSGVAFYLVHNLEAEGEFATLEKAQATSFGRACHRAGVKHVIYLGGLYPDDRSLSQHLESRRQVGEILRAECGALVVRAGIIIGAGSASFEIMRDLAARLPVMVAPRWVRNRCQAIYIEDAVEALARATAIAGDRELDLVGPEVLTYGEMLQRLGRGMGRAPLIVPVPVLTPQLSSHWLRFITAVPLPVARALVNSLKHEALAARPDLCAEVGVDPVSFTDAVTKTLASASRVTVSEVTGSHHYRGEVTLDQEFTVAGVDWRSDASTLGRIDTALFRSTSRAVPFLRWTGSRITLGGVTLIALSPLSFAAHQARARRAVVGGALVARPGGHLTYRVDGANRAGVVVGLDAFAPRLPGPLYRAMQQPLHRALVRAAVRTVAEEQA